LCCLSISFAMGQMDLSSWVDTTWNKITSYCKHSSDLNLSVFIDIHLFITNNDMTEVVRYWLCYGPDICGIAVPFATENTVPLFKPRRMALRVTQRPSGWVRVEGVFAEIMPAATWSQICVIEFKIIWDYPFIPNSLCLLGVTLKQT